MSTRKLIAIFGLVTLAACQANHKTVSKSQQRDCKGSSNGSHAVGKWDACTEDDFITSEGKKIQEHKALLIKAGRMGEDFGMDALILGRYDWHGNGDGYFGAYSFYEPAFQQAMRGWFLHGKVIEGSNELWAEDESVKFDRTIIGYKLPSMYMSWMQNGHYKSAWFTARIIGVKDDGKTAILSEHAPHHAEQWEMQIVPAGWKDMCNCTNNFHPSFVDGQPVVKQ